MAIDIAELEKWFLERPKWLQVAARMLVEKEALSTHDFEELAQLCISEATGEEIQYSGLPAGALNFPDTAIPLRLNTIEQVKGINALSCTRPLNFGDKPITIIYGRNGSGKSGYIRLLKHVCSARKPGPLHANVFADGAESQSARICYTKGANQFVADWNGTPVPDLAGIEVYDTASGLAYVHEENEVSVEPSLLRFFTSLAAVCTRASELIDNKSNLLVRQLPQLPGEYTGTSAEQWLMNLRSNTEKSDLETIWFWGEEQKVRAAELTKRLAEGNPADKARLLRRQKGTLDDLKVTLQNCWNWLSDEKFGEILAARNDAANKKKASGIDAQKVFANAPLEGVGAESWQLLWNAARAYSNECAYIDKPFPVVYNSARCVLCQSTIDAEAKQRLESFEAFVCSNLQKQADDAQKLLNEEIQKFPSIPETQDIELKLQAGSQDSKDLSMQLFEFRNILAKRSESFMIAPEMSYLEQLPDLLALNRLSDACEQLENEATVLDEDAKGENRDELSKELKELNAREWLYQQRESIKEEIGRLKRVASYQAARDLTSTQALSRRKSLLADELVTKAYIERFQTELANFDANSIRVKI